VNQSIRRRFWLYFGLCGAAAAPILFLMPAEKTIGQAIKSVYLHGALSRAGMIGLLAGGLLGLIFLLRPRPPLARWTRALTLSGWLYWTAHFTVSMPATRLTWGPWIAWEEPRVTMTLQVIGAGLVVIVVSWLLGSERFTAGANALLGAAILLSAINTGVLWHPLDAIGSSPSATLRFIYLLLLIPVVGSMALVAWRLMTAGIKQSELDGGERFQGGGPR